MISRLRQTAQKQAEILQLRDEVVGLGLYGSLSYDRVTPFSDLDIFVITTESEHTHVEYRVIDGIRVDFIWEPLKRWWEKNQDSNWYLLKGLLLGSDDSILYDPENIIKEKRDQLRAETTYERWVLPDIIYDLEEVNERFITAVWQQEEGLFLEAWRNISGWVDGYLPILLTEFTNHKRVEEAAQAMGIPELNEKIQRLHCLLCTIKGFTPESARNQLEVDKAHWSYQLENVWQPLREHLIAQGVDSPEKLEIKGELILTYDGVCTYDLERAITEHGFSLEWAEADLERGDVLEAIDKIHYEDIVGMADEKWRRIDNAITEAGYDTSMIIKDFLASEEFHERTEIARKARKASGDTPVTAEHVHELIEITHDYVRLFNEYLVSQYPDATKTMPKFHLMSRAEMLQWCHDRSTRIDNDVVSIVVNKQRAAVENLIFKFGTDSDLVETYWDENNLIDLFSADYLSLSKEWTVEKEEQGENEAHLIFSQEEGYRVALNIWWSEAGITVEHLFQLPQPICINNNIAVGGKGSPKPRNDHWAMRLDGKVVIGDYAYEGGAHVFLCPTDGTYLTPEGCWVAAWNEDVDEVCGFTFSPNCGCIIGRGASTDFEFYLPAGESTLRFHVAKPKPDPPYRALQKWACNEEPVPLALDTDGEKPLSPFVDDK